MGASSKELRQAHNDGQRDGAENVRTHSPLKGAVDRAFAIESQVERQGAYEAGYKNGRANRS